MVTTLQLLDLLETTLVDLPVFEIAEINRKQLYEMWGHPVLTLIKSGQQVPVGLRIYYGVPASWILEWKRHYG